MESTYFDDVSGQPRPRLRTSSENDEGGKYYMLEYGDGTTLDGFTIQINKQGTSPDERNSTSQINGTPIPYFPPRVAKNVAAQVALGVAYLPKYGIIHGDLHLGNVLLYSSKLQTTSHAELDHMYGKPIIQLIRYWNNEGPVTPSIHYPTTIVYYPHDPYPIMDTCISAPHNIHIKLCDFGESSFYHSPHDSNHPLRAPEIIFHDIVSPAPSMDIWTL
ncbi:hypothetical protein BDQ17DRAFT_1411310 [Cyathus striatus]|nr:hypothetical protein BDQ17DRAFT_1411310 [Cyathus striatus]